jgi:hypothetical protein
MPSFLVSKVFINSIGTIATSALNRNKLQSQYDSYENILTSVTLLSNLLLPSFDNSIRFRLFGFTYYLTLSSEFFSTFPHGTCLLSESGLYLALGEVYHLLWAVFPNNPTQSIY